MEFDIHNMLDTEDEYQKKILLVHIVHIDIEVPKHIMVSTNQQEKNQQNLRVMDGERGRSTRV